MMKVKNYGSNQTIVEDNGCSVLYSYETPVALIVMPGNRAYKTDRKWSVTTSKHINQWLRKEGFDPNVSRRGDFDSSRHLRQLERKRVYLEMKENTTPTIGIQQIKAGSMIADLDGTVL